MTEKHTPFAHVCFDKSEEELFLTGPGKDTKPLYSAETVEQLEAENDSLRQRIAELERLYGELLYEVQKKFPDETRHQTALRYIRNAEKPKDQAIASAKGGAAIAKEK